MITGPHGRDVSQAEANWSGPQPVKTGPITFHDVLDALNPLQFLPVVGTIYRVATGDDGSPALRTAVSLIGGALTGGPVGIVTSIVGLLAERLFHFEQVARSLVVGAEGKPASAAVSPAPVPAATPAQAVAAYVRAAELPARIVWGGAER